MLHSCCVETDNIDKVLHIISLCLAEQSHELRASINDFPSKSNEIIMFPEDMEI